MPGNERERFTEKRRLNAGFSRETALSAQNVTDRWGAGEVSESAAHSLAR